MHRPGDTGRSIGVALGLLGVVAAGVAARLHTSWVLASAERPSLYGADSYYHMRRIWLTLGDLPHVPYVDRFCEYPLELRCHTWPGGFDLALAALARLALGPGAHQPDVERLCAFAIPVIGALGALLVFALSRRITGGWWAVVAAAVYVLLPATVVHGAYARVDHHVLEPILALALLGAYLRTRRHAVASRGWWGWALGGGLVGGFTVASLPAAPAYLGITAAVCALDVVVSALRGEDATRWRRSWLAGGITLGLALVAGLVYFATTPCWALPGTLDVSPFGLVFPGAAWLGLVALGVCLHALQQRRSLSPLGLAAALLALGALATLSFVVLPQVLAGAREWLSFLAGEQLTGVTEEWWSLRSAPLVQVLMNFSPLLLLAPLGLAGMLLAVIRSAPGASVEGRAADSRASDTEAMVTRLAWSAVVLGVGLVQAGYFRGLVAAAVALQGAWLAGAVTRGRLSPGAPPTGATPARLVRGLAAGAVLIGCMAWTLDLAPPLGVDSRRSQALETLHWLRDQSPAVDPVAGAGQLPAYGVFADWDLGHWINYVAERPSVANPHLPPSVLAGARRADCERGLCRWIQYALAPDEAELHRLMERTRSRYLIVGYLAPERVDRYLRWMGRADESYIVEHDGRPRLRPEFWSLAPQRLYLLNGGAGASGGRPLPALPHFRLIYASSQEQVWPAGDRYPYFKVFEYLPRTARLVGRAGPGEPVSLSLELSDEAGRSFSYRQEVRADAGGRFALDAPYAQSGAAKPGGVRPREPYQLRSGDRVAEVSVAEQQVRSGAEVPVAWKGVSAGGRGAARR